MAYKLNKHGKVVYVNPPKLTKKQVKWVDALTPIDPTTVSEYIKIEDHENSHTTYVKKRLR